MAVDSSLSQAMPESTKIGCSIGAFPLSHVVVLHYSSDTGIGLKWPGKLTKFFFIIQFVCLILHIPT